MAGRAGGSAQREYERRRDRDAARRRRNRPARLAVALATPFVVYLAVRFGAPWGFDWIMDTIASAAQTERTDNASLDADTTHMIGLILATGATIRVASVLWGSRQSTEAWRTGAEGEAATGRLLDGLPDGYEVRHDLAMPGSRANIDHVVVGPTGVFTIETKRYQDGVRIAGDQVTSGGRSRASVVDQALRQAGTIAQRLGRPVTPLVIVHGGVERGWFSSTTVRGVRFCSPRQLAPALTRGPAVLPAEQVAALISQLDAGSRRVRPSGAPSTDVRTSAVGTPALAASVAPPDSEPAGCRCGGSWVQRTRRADGAPFLGCSRFPACRTTRNLP